MRNQPIQRAQRGQSLAIFDKKLLAGLLSPRRVRGSSSLGGNQTDRHNVVMLFLPKPKWTYVPLEMEEMTRLEVYMRTGQEKLSILVPKPGWGYLDVEMADFTRLEIFKRVLR